MTLTIEEIQEYNDSISVLKLKEKIKKVLSEYNSNIQIDALDDILTQLIYD